jgi:hypothetical protein
MAEKGRRSTRRTAEEPPTRRTCGTMVVHERLLRSDPSYLAGRVDSENRAFLFARRPEVLGRTGVTVIPVVVHVVHNTAAQNISDEQIKSQIDVLNRDYRKANPDVSNAPAPFLPLAADARVEFELATTDPSGNATDGITRTSTTTAGFTDDDKVKSAATGGADAWPRDKYLNFWVCPLGGGLLGYAQFPGGPAATDGVVILHSAFGTTGTAAAPFDLGRTATHEVGHWLNLRHIWGDDGGGCNGDDFVADTPNAADSNFGTPTFPHVTCANGPNGDMFMNYMDYTDDVAMFMFTAGQVTRMQAALDGDRASIGHVKDGGLTNPVLDAIVTTPATDVVTSPGTDVPQSKFHIDHPTLKFLDDPITTLKFRDDHTTLKFADDQGTLKFLEDPQPKAPFDVPDPGPWSDPFGGFGGFGGRSPAPFILATPHHSMAWTQSFPGAAQSAAGALRRRIAEYEQILQQAAQADQEGRLSSDDTAQVEQLYIEYQRLVGELQQLGG